MDLNNKINIYEGDAVEILPNLNNKYDMVFIMSCKGKIYIFLRAIIKNVK